MILLVVHIYACVLMHKYIRFNKFQATDHVEWKLSFLYYLSASDKSLCQSPHVDSHNMSGTFTRLTSLLCSLSYMDASFSDMKLWKC